MYKALYRKYRPTTFSDVVGQEHITSTLKYQVQSNRLSHAYLFVGTRGTGKTTCAKILSKAVNCQHPEDGNPCNKCSSCIGIDNGSVLDVVELDAASNNGVESIRAIRDEAVYTPSEVHKRVYIVDEVHMLSTAAFNALLKILEEPPEHLIFILATTELHKVPATILSRCQRFSFKRITVDDISGRLQYVAEQEHIDLTDDAATLLARLADGSMRDALSLMDQCRSSQQIDEEQVASCIGLAGAEEIVRLLNSVENGDTDGALAILDQLYMAGKDPGGVLSELISIMRDIMVMRMAPKSGGALLSGNFSLNMLRGHKISTEKLLWCVKTLQESLSALERSADRRTTAEFCLVQLTNERLFTTADALLARISELESKLTGDIIIQSSANLPTEQPKLENTSIAPHKQAVLSDEDKKNTVSPPPPIKSGIESGQWQQILNSIDPAKARLLTDHIPEYTDNRVTVNVGPGFVYSLLNQPDNLRMLETAAEKVLGKPTRVIISDKSSEVRAQGDKLDALRKFNNVKFE